MNETNRTLFSCRDVGLEFKLGRQVVAALQGVTVDIAQGTFACLCGPSGSGKSTLLNLLGLIEPLQRGSILFDGADIAMLSEAEKNALRRHHIGFVFQNFHLIEVLRADENVEYFLTRQGVAKGERGKRVEDALRAVGLWEHRAKKPLEMSGGQRQRVAIARALAKAPWVIIADEPTASLDQATGREVMGILRALNEERGVTIVLASHDAMVLEYARERITLTDGTLAGVERLR